MGSICRPVSEKEREGGPQAKQYWEGGVLSYGFRLGGGSGAEARSGGALLVTRTERGVCRILKPYCKQVPFDPLKCMAGVNVQCKKDWCVEI